MPDKFYDKFLNPEEALFRRKTYRLNRKTSSVTIVTYEHIAGSSPFQFISMPSDLTFTTARTKEQFVGKGNTEAEALKNCLEKVQNFGFDDFYETVDDSLPVGESDQ